MEKITERLALFWLANASVSTKKINALLSHMSAVDVWEGTDIPLLRQNLGASVCDSLLSSRNLDAILERLDFLERYGVKVVTRADEDFPERLKQKEVNPPLLIYAKGDTSLLGTNCVAVVGSRSCTRYGREAAELISRGLVTGGVTVVSGLATGVDAYAHAEAVNACGRTIAVLGGGFDHVYPSENRPLYKRILGSGGLIVCENPPEAKPLQHSFPERNRIISGLSLGVVLVEACEKSGALLTARLALEQNRELFAIPGCINSKNSEGTNRLLLEGNAHFTLSAEQIFKELRLQMEAARPTKNLELDLPKGELAVYNKLKEDIKTFDQLVVETECAPWELSPILTNLELKGLIRRLAANFYSIVSV